MSEEETKEKQQIDQAVEDEAPESKKDSTHAESNALEHDQLTSKEKANLEEVENGTYDPNNPNNNLPEPDEQEEQSKKSSTDTENTDDIFDDYDVLEDERAQSDDHQNINDAAENEGGDHSVEQELTSVDENNLDASTQEAEPKQPLKPLMVMDIDAELERVRPLVKENEPTEIETHITPELRQDITKIQKDLESKRQEIDALIEEKKNAYSPEKKEKLLEDEIKEIKQGLASLYNNSSISSNKTKMESDDSSGDKAEDKSETSNTFENNLNDGIEKIITLINTAKEEYKHLINEDGSIKKELIKNALLLSLQGQLQQFTQMGIDPKQLPDALKESIDSLKEIDKEPEEGEKRQGFKNLLKQSNNLISQACDDLAQEEIIKDDDVKNLIEEYNKLIEQQQELQKKSYEINKKGPKLVPAGLYLKALEQNPDSYDFGGDFRAHMVAQSLEELYAENGYDSSNIKKMLASLHMLSPSMFNRLNENLSKENEHNPKVLQTINNLLAKSFNRIRKAVPGMENLEPIMPEDMPELEHLNSEEDAKTKPKENKSHNEVEVEPEATQTNDTKNAHTTESKDNQNPENSDNDPEQKNENQPSHSPLNPQIANLLLFGGIGAGIGAGFLPDMSHFLTIPTGLAAGNVGVALYSAFNDASQRNPVMMGAISAVIANILVRTVIMGVLGASLSGLPAILVIGLAGGLTSALISFIKTKDSQKAAQAFGTGLMFSVLFGGLFEIFNPEEAGLNVNPDADTVELTDQDISGSEQQLGQPLENQAEQNQNGASVPEETTAAGNPSSSGPADPSTQESIDTARPNPVEETETLFSGSNLPAYQIQGGDSLSKIVMEQYGVSGETMMAYVEILAQQNGVENIHLIQEGAVLENMPSPEAMQNAASTHSVNFDQWSSDNWSVSNAGTPPAIGTDFSDVSSAPANDNISEISNDSDAPDVELLYADQLQELQEIQTDAEQASTRKEMDAAAERMEDLRNDLRGLDTREGDQLAKTADKLADRMHDAADDIHKLGVENSTITSQVISDLDSFEQTLSEVTVESESQVTRQIEQPTADPVEETKSFVGENKQPPEPQNTEPSAVKTPTGTVLRFE